MPSSKMPGAHGKRGAIFDQNTYICTLQNVLADNVDTKLTNKSEVQHVSYQGPVVKSIVSLTSSLRGQLVKCFTTL